MNNLGVLRFITAGSVDDGKSTLIGRLLYDSKSIMVDQVNALEKAKNKRTNGEAIDFSLLTDGLEAEREQGITIDIAYRYFSSGKRKFIIADAPGHFQYTRNMVTGASTSDVAIILIDVTRVADVDKTPVLLAQTKRHSKIVRLLGLSHVIVAINKMDLVDYKESVFNNIQNAYAELANKIGLTKISYVPVSALRGDNVVNSSDAMPWYKGPTLLEILEGIELSVNQDQRLRFPVQFVARQDGSSADDFRGYMGRIESGRVETGQLITISPAGLQSSVKQIYGRNGVQSAAQEGDCVTIELTDDVDISRGDVLISGDDPSTAVKEFDADICWFDAEPLNLQRKYLMRIGTATVMTKVRSVHQVMDIETLSYASESTDIKMNDIGTVSLVLAKPVLVDAYQVNPAMGAFVLIDDVTHHTVAAGMVR